MNPIPISLLYTQDQLLLQRVRGFLHDRSTVHPAGDVETLERLLRQHREVVLFLDLREAGGAERARALAGEAVIIAFGAARADPGLQAAAAGAYAVEPTDVDRLRLQGLFEQAQAHLRLSRENRMLKEDLRRLAAAPAPSPREPPTTTWSLFAGAFRRFDNMAMLFESLVEGVAAGARVSRVALFAAAPGDRFRFRAGVKCLPETRRLEFDGAHPLARWLGFHAHSLSRAMLGHVAALDERALLEQSLDLFGVEVILPLFGRERLLGWLCLGRPATGALFEPRDLEGFAQLAEYVSVTIENALLHESLAIQKTMAESLLQAIPLGIMATDAEGLVRWFNRAAAILLDVGAGDAIGAPVERVSGPLAAHLRACMAEGRRRGPSEWRAPGGGRPLAIETFPLRQAGLDVGAMALVRDLTEERILREKGQALDRAAFWNELAAAISHELRNPLVAISTFAQLLPEQYADEEFRTRFRDLIRQEVARLNGMIDQLDAFAHPPKLDFGPVAVRPLLETVRERAGEVLGPVATPLILEVVFALPPIRGDRRALCDSLVRLCANALAAVEGRDHPAVVLRARLGAIGAVRPAIVLEVADNGPGIAIELREKVFSPFYTTKARGVGLGLPVARRTVIDHEGLIQIEQAEPQGAVVRLTLPVWEAPRVEGDAAGRVAAAMTGVA